MTRSIQHPFKFPVRRWPGPRRPVQAHLAVPNVYACCVTMGGPIRRKRAQPIELPRFSVLSAEIGAGARHRAGSG